MSMLKDIHDYIKKDYEAGNYDDAKAAYTSWKTENNQQSNLTDFEMGIQKAQSDYKKKRDICDLSKASNWCRKQII